MKKRVCALLVAMLFTALATGCTQTPDESKTSDTSKTSATDSVSDAPTDTADTPEAEATFDVNVVEEFDVLVLGGISFDLSDMEDTVGQEITKKTGVKLNFEFPVGDWNEKLALVLAGGEYPDLIVNKDTAITQLVDAGALVGLKEKIENSPNIMSYLGEYAKRLTYSIDDPEYYGFGAANMIDDPKPDQYWNPAFALQNDVVKKAGFPEVKTLEDYEKLIADYVAENPTINDQPTIGLSLIAADGWRWKISVTNPAFISTGKPDDGEWFIDPETHEASFHYKDPNEKEYFRWLNHMNDIGLLDPESFTQSYDAYQAKISSGRVVGLIDALWEYDIARKQASETVGPERDYVPFPVLQDPDNMNWSLDRSSGYVTAGGYMVTTACENVDKIVNFFDYLCTEEAQILKNWGIEGEHYDIVDGVRVFKPEIKAEKMDPNKSLDFRKTTGIGRYGESNLYTPGFGWKTSDGQLLQDYDEMELWDTYSPIQQEIMEAYGVRGFNQLFPAASTIEQSPFGAAWTLPIGQTEETKVIMGKVEEITLQDIAKAVLAKPEDFDAEWDNFMKNVEDVNLSVLEDEVTALVAERIEMWGN
jgi:ABC-type sugar transport system, periplasmic component